MENLKKRLKKCMKYIIFSGALILISLAFYIYEKCPTFDTLSIVIILVLVVLLLTSIDYWYAAFKPKWYKPHYGIRNGKLDYPDIKKLINLKKDPADDFDSSPFPYTRENGGFWIGLLYLLFIVLTFASLFFIALFILDSLSKKVVELIKSDFGIIATILLGVATIFYNMRLQARARNRQKWIGEMREVINRLIAIITNYVPSHTYWKSVKDDYKKSMFKLELLINPSEKEHRTLLALIRRGAIHYSSQKWGGIIAGIDDKMLDKVISSKGQKLIKICSRKTENGRKCKQNPSLPGLCRNCRDRKENISYIIRLSNLILKREWEQVKYIR